MRLELLYAFRVNNKFAHNLTSETPKLQSLAKTPQRGAGSPGQGYSPALGHHIHKQAGPKHELEPPPRHRRHKRERNKITIVDVSIPFENEPQALSRARQAKLANTTALLRKLRAQGYETSVDAFIVGALGTWDPENEEVLRKCGVSQRYATLMLRLMCSDAIE
ncbi:hypothetical protein JTB14_035840 [Gonioctena quinquepunctata]|nr:hypothetical protein JTB14_035840 [Gonioctena quinquepunctata]